MHQYSTHILTCFIMRTSLLLTLLSAGALCMSARTFDVGGIRYKVIEAAPTTVSVESKSPAYTGDIVIPSSVTNDGQTYSVVSITQSSTASTTDGAFANCSGLTSVSLPASLTHIGNYSFNGCTALTTIVIPDNVSTFGNGAFQNCTSLNSITMPANAESLGEYLFSGCAKLTALTLPEGITEIPKRALYGLKALTGISFPSTLTEIGDDNFYNCNALETLSIPEGVTKLGQYFGAGCTALHKIELPSTLTSIGKYAFWNSKTLTSFSCAAVNPPAAKDAFYGWSTLYPNCTLYVPEAAISAYKTAEVWSNFTNVEALLPPPADINTDFTVDGVTYIVKENTDRLAVTVIALDDPDGEGLQYSGSIIIPETVKYEGRDYTVTAIGVGAFYSCKQLVSVSLPSSIEAIGDFSFARCEALTSVGILPAALKTIGPKAFIYTALTGISVDNGNKNFVADQDILYTLDANGVKTKVLVCAAKSTGSKTIPEGVTAIEYAAFAKCEEMSGLTLPSTLTSIGEYAFDGCVRLYKLSIPDNVSSIGAHAFYKCSYLADLTLPANLNTVEEGTFMFCSALTELPLPSTVSSIGKYAFEACTGLTEITIPAACVFIGDHAFEECRGITSVSIPASLGKIDDFAFLGCSNLVSLSLPRKMDLIGYGAFKDCAGIESISMPESLGELRGYAFGNCVKLTSIVIPDGITAIEDRLFWGCTALADIHIPVSVTEIKEFAFDRTPITELILHEGVTFIGEDAFQHCKKLEVISLPSTVTTIDKYAFWDCVSARQFTSLATEPADAAKAFSSGFPASTCALFVPESAVDKYKEADGWKLFTNIAAIPEVGYVFTSEGVTYRVTAIGEEENTVEVIKGENSYSGDVTLPESVNDYFDYTVTAIGDDAFAGCAELNSITLPASLKYIGHKAFSGCTALAKITCLGENPADVEEDAFEGIDPGRIILSVPDSAVEKYKNANVWKEFFKNDAIDIISVDIDSCAPVFDISGRKVGNGTLPSEGGIYIVNGRKIIVHP